MPRHVAPAYRIGQQPAHCLTMLRHKGQFLRLVFRLPVGLDTHLQVFPGQQYLPPQSRPLHRHTHLHGAFQPRQLPLFKRNGHAAVKQRVRTFHFYQLFQSVGHTLILSAFGLYRRGCFRCRKLVLFPLIRKGVRIEHTVGLRTVLRHSHLKRAFYLGRFRKRQLAAQVGKQRTVRYQYALSGHQAEFPRSLHQDGGLRSGPAYRVLLLAVLCPVVQRTAQQCMQVLVVHLDYIKRGGNAAVALRNNQHRGSRRLFSLNLRGFGFLAAQVERTFLDVTHHKVLVFHGTDAVHEILVHHFFSLMVNNTPANKPANTPMINTRTGFGGRFSSV
nr:MAG TPA: hypothetical protein [Caudoviricetes sp.]